MKQYPQYVDKNNNKRSMFMFPLNQLLIEYNQLPAIQGSARLSSTTYV